MYFRLVLLYTCFLLARVNTESVSLKDLTSYSKLFNLNGLFGNETDNELWRGLFRDCDKRVTFSCIQKNAYSYLDNVFIERDNITVFDGLVLTKNNLKYGTCSKKDDRDNVDENLVEDSSKDDCESEEVNEDSRNFDDNSESPLEEVTNALRKKTAKFLATRNYEVQLPEFFFNGATVKVSPREVDENGALLRVDFAERAAESQGRIFKKIRKFIQNKLMTSFLALLLLIKLIKVKFMFVIPFLFGVGAAKKLFLKLLLFFIPAFAHVFKLCSSYYTAHGTKYHHHHHQIAHHHHHVPVPVPVPTYYDHHHHHHHEEEFDGYDYAHPHIQYRKDMEELKEWGIEPYEELYPEETQPIGVASQPPGHGVPPTLPGSYSSPYGLHQYAPNARPIVSNYPEKRPMTAHNLAYSGYLDDKYNRRTIAQGMPNVPLTPTNLPANLQSAANLKNAYTVFAQQNARVQQGQRNTQVTGNLKNPVLQRQAYEDEYYGPIVGRLEEIFGQLRFYEENCRERLVCSMYKSPAIYTPHSNLVSNELSRDPRELKRGVTESAASQKFHRYLNAARMGQDGGDCSKNYPCHINTE